MDFGIYSPESLKSSFQMQNIALSLLDIFQKFSAYNLSKTSRVSLLSQSKEVVENNLNSVENSKNNKENTITLRNTALATEGETITVIPNTKLMTKDEEVIKNSNDNIGSKDEALAVISNSNLVTKDNAVTDISDAYFTSKAEAMIVIPNINPDISRATLETNSKLITKKKSRNRLKRNQIFMFKRAYKTDKSLESLQKVCIGLVHSSNGKPKQRRWDGGSDNEPLFGGSLEVRYLTEISELIRNRFSPCICQCNPELCQGMMSRLVHHQKICQPQTMSRSTQPSISEIVTMPKNMQTSNEDEQDRMLILQLNSKSDIKSGQGVKDEDKTNIPLYTIDQKNSRNKENHKKPDEKNIMDLFRGTFSNNHSSELKQEDTKCEKYFDDSELRNKITAWLYDIPLYAPQSSAVVKIKEAVLNDLVNKFKALYDQNNNNEHTYSTEIDKCYDALPMWLPGPKREQAEYKNNLTKKLLNEITTINFDLKQDNSNDKEPIQLNTESNYVANFEIFNTDSVNYSTISPVNDPEYLIKREIYDWLIQAQIQKRDSNASPIEKIELMNLLFSRLEPHIKKDASLTNYRIMVRGKIIEILDNYSLCFAYDGSNKITLNQLSEDLANRLYGLCFLSSKNNLPTKSNDSSNKYSDQRVFHLLNHSKYHKDDLAHVKDTIEQSLKVTQSNDLFDLKNVIDKLLQEIELSQKEKLMPKTQVSLQDDKTDSRVPEASSTIENQIENTTPLSNSNTSSTHGHQSSSETNSDSMNNINADEAAYYKAIKDKILDWVNCLPIDYYVTENSNFKENMVDYLTNDIVNRYKFQHFNPNITQVEESEYMRYQIFKWLANILSIDELNYIFLNNITNDLIKRLKQVPVPSTLIIKATSEESNVSVTFPNDIRTNNNKSNTLGTKLKSKLKKNTAKKSKQLYSNDNIPASKECEVKVVKKDTRNKYGSSEFYNQTENLNKQYMKNLNYLNVIEKKSPKLAQMHVNHERQKCASVYKNASSSFSVKRIDSNDSVTPINNKYPKLKNPTDFLYNEIENWCLALPVDSKAIKNDILTNLLQKIGILNIDPNTYNDIKKYSKYFSDEIEMLLDPLPITSSIRENLRNDLVNKIVKANDFANKEYAGDRYKKQLEDTIELSMPIRVLPKHKPYYEKLKCHLAEKYIIDRYHSENKILQSKYEKTVIDDMKELLLHSKTKYFSASQILNILTNKLQQVPDLCDGAIDKTVKNITTKAKLSEWFKNLPINPPFNSEEALRQEKILTKKLHNAESKQFDHIIQHEVVKWLRKIPLDLGRDQNLETLLNQLKETLKANKSPTKNVPLDCNVNNTMNVSLMICGPQLQVNPQSNDAILVHTKINQPKPGSISLTDRIYETVNSWCANLPIRGNASEIFYIRDNTANKIVLKISELNTNPFSNDDLYFYNKLLEDATYKILSDVPNLKEHNLSHIIESLIKAIEKIRPIMLQELNRCKYRQQLNDTLTDIIGNLIKDKQNLDILKEDVVDSFIEYTYSKTIPGDASVQKQKALKAAIDLCLETFVAEAESNKNHILDVMEKVLMPSHLSLKSEVEEIQIKRAVNEWMQKVSFPKFNLTKLQRRNNMKNIITKKLIDIKGSGCISENKSIVEKEIIRYLTKMGISDNLEIYANDLINHLEKIEDRNFINMDKVEESGNHQIRKPNQATNKKVKPNVKPLSIVHNVPKPHKISSVINENPKTPLRTRQNSYQNHKQILGNKEFQRQLKPSSEILRKNEEKKSNYGSYIEIISVRSNNEAPDNFEQHFNKHTNNVETENPTIDHFSLESQAGSLTEPDSDAVKDGNDGTSSGKLQTKLSHKAINCYMNTGGNSRFYDMPSTRSNDTSSQTLAYRRSEQHETDFQIYVQDQTEVRSLSQNPKVLNPAFKSCDTSDKQYNLDTNSSEKPKISVSQRQPSASITLENQGKLDKGEKSPRRKRHNLQVSLEEEHEEPGIQNENGICFCQGHSDWRYCPYQESPVHRRVPKAFCYDMEPHVLMPYPFPIVYY